MQKKTGGTQYVFLFQSRSFILCFGQKVVHNLTHPMGHCCEKMQFEFLTLCHSLLITVLVRMCRSLITYGTTILRVSCMHITGKSTDT